MKAKLMVRSKLTALLFIIIIGQATSQVHRLYSHSSENSHSHACENGLVILTCNTTGSRVVWTATSDLTERVVFISSDPARRVTDREGITGILLQNNPLSDGSNLRNFVTELLVYYTTPSTREINVTCSSNNESILHVISPPAFPRPPLFTAEPQLLSVDSNGTLTRYYLQWEAPSNIEDIDLDYYQLYANDTLVQRVHPDQRYAVIPLQKDTTTTVKVAAVDRCRQISNYSSAIIRSNITNNLENSEVEVSTNEFTSDVPQTESQLENGFSGSQHNIVSNLVVIYTTILTLILLKS